MPKVEWQTERRSDGAEYRQICLSDVGDWKLFDRIARFLEEYLGGEWTEKLDGLDQRYWDLEVGDEKITLHLEHFLGISLYCTEIPDEASFPLLERAFDLLAEQQESWAKPRS